MDPEHAPAGHSYVRAYLCKELSRHGKLRFHEFDHNERKHQNLAVELPGARNDRLIIVGDAYGLNIKGAMCPRVRRPWRATAD